jgi:hypothetical protein
MFEAVVGAVVFHHPTALLVQQEIGGVLQYLRQISARCTAWIIHIVLNLLPALGCKLVEPINELYIATTPTNEAG